MLIARAEYRVKSTFRDQNIRNIECFLSIARSRLKEGSSYSVSTDGDAFMHLFFHADPAEGDMLGQIPEFCRFLDELMAGGCEVPPVITHLEEIQVAGEI